MMQAYCIEKGQDDWLSDNAADINIAAAVAEKEGRSLSILIEANRRGGKRSIQPSKSNKPTIQTASQRQLVELGQGMQQQINK